MVSSEEEGLSFLRKSKRILLVSPEVLQNSFMYLFRNKQTLKEKIIDSLNRDLQAPIEIRDAGEKGRGVFATEDIPSSMYICEYKTTNVYNTDKFIRKQREYETNEEIFATITFKVGRTSYYYDATRRFNQMGRYINHSRLLIFAHTHPFL